MRITTAGICTLALAFAATNATADGHGEVAGLEESANEKTAITWTKASYESHSGFMDVVKKHMADDGVFVPSRYVGFGFQYNPDESDTMVVSVVIPNSPAAEVLEVGDIFVSVGGVAATKENRDRLSFRGKPGQAVQAVISRDGKEKAIEVKRGVISSRTPKAVSLENMASANSEDWPVDSYEIDEVISEGNVVYVVSNYTETEPDTEIEYTERIIRRYVFDDDGKVSWAGGGLGESRFVLEQQGYTISR